MTPKQTPEQRAEQAEWQLGMVLAVLAVIPAFIWPNGFTVLLQFAGVYFGARLVFRGKV